MIEWERRLLDFPIFIVGSPRSGTSVLAKALVAATYKGSYEGNLLSLLHTLDRQIDNHFRIFGSKDPAVLTSHLTAQHIKTGLYGKLRDLVDSHHGGLAWFDKTGNPVYGRVHVLSLPNEERLKISFLGCGNFHH